MNPDVLKVLHQIVQRGRKITRWHQRRFLAEWMTLRIGQSGAGEVANRVAVHLVGEPPSPSTRNRCQTLERVLRKGTLIDPPGNRPGIDASAKRLHRVPPG